MSAGFIVGICIASALIAVGAIFLGLAKIKRKKNKWAGWLIVLGVAGLISAIFNY